MDVLRRGTRFLQHDQASRKPTMIKTILVPGLNAAATSKALEMALQVAGLFDGHIELLHVHPDAVEMARYTASLDVESGMFAGEIWQALESADKARTALSREDFAKFTTKENLAAGHPVTASWHEVAGNEIEQTIHQAYYNDLVVFGRPAAPVTLSTLGVGDVLIGCGRPLLLAPSRPCLNPITTIVIAWKSTAAAARAVTAAMPLLMKAQKLVILGAAEGNGDAQSVLDSTERLAAHLRWHGLKPQAGHIKIGDRDPCEAIMQAASEKLHAGMLVMGGYGHSRARELLLGGFTRHVLREAPLPVFLCH
jgi:nucleotide-binding universal stress UspA family protein